MICHLSLGAVKNLIHRKKNNEEGWSYPYNCITAPHLVSLTIPITVKYG